MAKKNEISATDKAVQYEPLLAVVYSDGKDYSHLEPNSKGIEETAEEGEFNGACVYCFSENITITDEADICHDCGEVYT